MADENAPLRLTYGPLDWNGEFGDLLFDLEADPGQQIPLNDPQVEAVMIRKLLDLMRANHCPPEQFERLGLDPDAY